MTSVAPPGTPPPSGSPPQPSRPVAPGRDRRVERRMGLPNGRTVLGGLLMALAALAAFALATAGDDDDSVDVVVAARDLRAGEVIGADDLRMEAVEIRGEVGGLFGSLDAAVGRTMVGPTNAGEFLLASSTAEQTEGAGDTFELTLAVAPDRTPGGVVAGESVDVFATWNSDVTELIAVDAVALDIDDAGDDLIGGSELLIRLQVNDLSQIEAVVHAHATGDITLVRTPSQDAGAVGREYRPGEPVAEPSDPDEGNG